MNELIETNEAIIAQSNWVNTLFDSLQEYDYEQLPETVFDKQSQNESCLDVTHACFFKIEQLAFDSEYPRREAFENVVASLNDPNFNLVYILSGTNTGIDLYLGVVKNSNDEKTVYGESIQAKDYGKILKNVFEGNFNGSKLSPVRSSLVPEILKGAELYRQEDNEINAGMLLGIPTSNKKNSGKDEDFQGIDRLINTMIGLEWRIAVVCEPVTRTEILSFQNEAYELFNQLSLISKFNISSTDNEGLTYSEGTSSSDSDTKTAGYSKNESKSRGKSHGYGHVSKNSGTSTSEGTSESESFGHTEGKNESLSKNKGISKAVSVELANKHAQDLMKYIDEELLVRIKQGLNKGLFKTSVYYMAKDPAHAERLKSGLMSLFQGNEATHSPLVSGKLSKNYENSYSWLQTYQNHYTDAIYSSKESSILLSRPRIQETTGLCTYLTASEISLLAGLPQTEVPGLALKEIVDFGLNEKIAKDEEGIELGCMVQRGRRLDNIKFTLSRKTLSKHIFIAGVTGSGKTTTCHKLLSQANMPFMVIEPAKTEYRTLINNDNFKDVVVFTLGNETSAPFRINPFELIPGEVISSHIDMVKATFVSAFPMEASMPQILEEAIYKCYELKGWNIDTNENEIHGEHAFDKEVDSFPILSELLKVLEKIVDQKNFAADLAANYKGSLISRLSNLTVGSKGAMLNCSHSTDFNYIADHNVIMEMEDLKSPEDKSLLMGFVLSRLSAVIKARHKVDSSYRHITLIEEAHRLLSKMEYGDSGAKKGAVETFTDLLAEVRKYGEGLIVVDQIPNKLAPEVIKNTNTKIIHKILAKDDKETVGDTMLMDDKQKEYLSALETGNSVVFNEHTNKPVHVYITYITNTNEDEIPDEKVHKRFKAKKSELGACYDDLELQPYFKLFEEVCIKLTEEVRIKSEDKKDFSSNAQESFKKLSDFVINLSTSTNRNSKEIWSALIRRYELVTGKAISNYEDQVGSKKRFDYILNFFSEAFEKGDFSYKTVVKQYPDLFDKHYLI